MANVSSAEGTLTVLDVDGCRPGEVLGALQAAQDDFYYQFRYDTEPEPDEAGIGFYGLGRWRFSDTLAELWECMQHAKEDSRTTVVARKAIDLLERCRWAVEFTYNDIETGNGVLYSETDIFGHDEDTPINEVGHDIQDVVTYPCDVYHMVSIMGWDIEESLSETCLDAEGIKWFDRADVEEYIGSLRVAYPHDSLALEIEDAVIELAEHGGIDVKDLKMQKPEPEAER